ncbi:MAG: YkgJ family cysteine cluster protein [Geobacter sp.]|nr:YkgJ family cysteine cluster protein [Geobacter sp.]
MACRQCGTCCVAPDISALDKPLGERCRHLLPTGLCDIYATRPAVCASYRPDDLCGLITAPTLDERVANYLRLFGLAAAPVGVSGRSEA